MLLNNHIYCYFCVVSWSSGDPVEGVRGGAEAVGEKNFRSGADETAGTRNQETCH